MKTMTSAEFTKANIAALEEPVEIRRYTKVIGTYYPEGFRPAGDPAQPAQLALEISKAELVKQIEALEADNRHLKKLLAARAETVPGSTRYAKGDIVPDPFAALSKQDREFFERKLGKKK